VYLLLAIFFSSSTFVLAKSKDKDSNHKKGSINSTVKEVKNHEKRDDEKDKDRDRKIEKTIEKKEKKLKKGIKKEKRKLIINTIK
jgi:hypothetical protein